jgi:hypothetical protein
MRTIALSLLLLASCSRPQLRILPLPVGCHSLASLPMTVSLDSSATAYRMPVYVAMEAWEHALGRDAFVWLADDTVTADVLVVVGPLPGKRAGQANSKCANGPGVTLTMDYGLDEVHATGVGIHEFGHVLGLGHSDLRRSIMYPVVGATLMGDWDEEVTQSILDTDAHIAGSLHP